MSTSSIAPIAPKEPLRFCCFATSPKIKENVFFADGIQDDLVTSLARIKDLRLLAGVGMLYRIFPVANFARSQRNSALQPFEGSVRRTANRVLVNVQLTDATTERQIWSDRYDRTLKDSIALQGELAAEIATALAAKLSPEEKAQVEAKLTNNPDAYVVYLRGREFQMRPEVSRDNYVAANNATDTQSRWTRDLRWLTPDSPKYSRVATAGLIISPRCSPKRAVMRRKRCGSTRIADRHTW